MLTLPNLTNIEKVVFDYYLDFLLYLSHNKQGVSLMALYDHNDFDPESYEKIKAELYDFVNRIKLYNFNLLKDPGQLGIDFLMLRNYGEDNISTNHFLYEEDVWFVYKICSSYPPIYLYEKNGKVFLR